MIRAPIIAFFIAVIAALWIASGYYDPLGSSATVEEAVIIDETEEMVESQILPRVQVVSSVAIPKIREIKLYGRTEPDRTVEVKAETAGKINSINIIEGATIKKGSTIVKLSMDSRNAKLEEAKARLKFQEISYDAAEKLSKKQFKSEVKLAEQFAALESSKAALEIAKRDIARIRIKAPFEGVVEKLLLEVGDYVRVGDSVAYIVDLDPIVIAVQVTERSISQVKVGQSVLVEFLSGDLRKGEVGYISRSASLKTRTFRVEIRLENPTYEIPDGMTANVTMLTEPVSAHKVSPAVLTLNDQGALGVKIVDENNKVQFYAISIISDTTDGIWISGLPEKASLISVGQEFVKEGQVVEAFHAG